MWPHIEAGENWRNCDLAAATLVPCFAHPSTTMAARSYEEAIGFMLGNVVMDKDGVSSECHTYQRCSDADAAACQAEPRDRCCRLCAPVVHASLMANSPGANLG